MRGLSDTIARLSAAAIRWPDSNGTQSDSLTQVESFGSNPGALRAYIHIPPNLAPNAPLVVVLHGCTQTAAGYDKASGWSQLADEHGFALLYPEQQRANNANGCFNWFEPGDVTRDGGEVQSIGEMIADVELKHGIDPRRVFITGLSAGGAMAASMLAACPEVFAGGAIIAGIPHGVAQGMMQAFARMHGYGLPGEDELQTALHSASSHAGPWPRISIWHGSADSTVNAANAEAIGSQWRGVHKLPDRPSDTEQIDSTTRRTWRGAGGEALVEEYIVAGMGHGTPLKTKGSNSYGASAPYMLDVGISSTWHIARSWGIASLSGKDEGCQPRSTANADTVPARVAAKRLHGTKIEREPARPSATGAGKIIEDALRAAGLMK